VSDLIRYEAIEESIKTYRRTINTLEDQLQEEMRRLVRKWDDEAPLRTEYKVGDRLIFREEYDINDQHFEYSSVGTVVDIVCAARAESMFNDDEPYDRLNARSIEPVLVFRVDDHQGEYAIELSNMAERGITLTREVA
jgi:hypothetical protein